MKQSQRLYLCDQTQKASQNIFVEQALLQRLWERRYHELSLKYSKMQLSKIYLVVSCLVVLVALVSCADQVEAPKFDFEKSGEVNMTNTA